MQLETDPSLDLSEVLIIVDPLDATKVQYIGVRCGGTVRSGRGQCSAVQYSAVEFGAAQRCSVLGSPVQCGGVLSDGGQWSAVQRGAPPTPG